MQEEREHKGIFDRMRSLIIEDVPAEDHSPVGDSAGISPAGPPVKRHSNDDVDKMFADIENEVATKRGVPPPNRAGVSPSAATAPAQNADPKPAGTATAPSAVMNGEI